MHYWLSYINVIAYLLNGLTVFHNIKYYLHLGKINLLVSTISLFFAFLSFCCLILIKAPDNTYDEDYHYF